MHKDHLPIPDYVIGQPFTSDGGVGEVTVFVYESRDDINTAWQNILEMWRLSPPRGGGYIEKYHGIGEKAAGLVGGGQVIFTRCEMLVYLSPETRFDMGRYAIRLDKRLQPIACQIP